MPRGGRGFLMVVEGVADADLGWWSLEGVEGAKNGERVALVALTARSGCGVIPEFEALVMTRRVGLAFVSVVAASPDASFLTADGCASGPGEAGKGPCTLISNISLDAPLNPSS